MNHTTRDIDWIVKEVVRRLTNLQTATESHTDVAAEATSLRRRVITVESLPDRRSSAKRIVIPSTAIVTPAAKDEIRDRGLELVRGATTSIPPTDRKRLFVGYCGGTSVGLVDLAIMQRHYDLRELGQAPAEALAKQLSSQMGLADVAVLVCDQPSAAVCYANRHWQLRAFWAVDVASVEEARQSIGANVMVVQSKQIRSCDAVVATFLEGSI